MAIDGNGSDGPKQVGIVDTMSILTPLERSFEDFLKGVHPRAMRHAERFVGYDDATEAVQLCALWMWERWTQLPLESRTAHYFLAAVHHRVIDMRRRQKGHEELPEEDEDVILPDALLVRVHDGEVLDVELLDELVAALPLRQREVWTLVGEQGFSYEECSAELKLAYSTIAKHYTLACVKLRKGLEKAGYVLSGPRVKELSETTEGGRDE